MTPEETAMRLALEAHGQQRYGGEPYNLHLNHVVGILSEILQSTGPMQFYDRGIASAAGWLHDSLEDTDLTYAEIQEKCGSAVAVLVHSVTDSPGLNRHERKAATYPKTRATGALAVAVKLADRIANVTTGIRTSDAGMLRMYRKEQAAFAAALYRFEDGLDLTWLRLDGLLKSGVLG